MRLKEIVKNALKECEEKNITDWASLKGRVRDELRNYLYEKQKKAYDITNYYGNII